MQGWKGQTEYVMSQGKSIWGVTANLQANQKELVC